MAYDNTNFYGDLIVSEYDDKGNFMTPPTPTGYYVYHILGDGFDLMSEMCTQFMNDFSILTASTKGLDNFWGVSYNMPRPSLYEGTSNERKLTDEEYRIYLYLRNCRLMTREDIEINMNKCFAVEKENSQYYIFFSTETNYLSVVNHLNYNSKTTEESNLAKNDEDTSLNFITNFASDEDTLLIESGLSEVEEVIEVINVPSPNGYDPAFLELLENYISVKGNLKIKEYSI